MCLDAWACGAVALYGLLLQHLLMREYVDDAVRGDGLVIVVRRHVCMRAMWTATAYVNRLWSMPWHVLLCAK